MQSAFRRIDNREGVNLGFLLRWFVTVIILIVILAISIKLSRADYAIDIVNLTFIVNSNNITVNLSDNVYVFNNSNLTAIIQQNFTVFFNSSQILINQTIITNATCSNNSISLSCSCPVCPSIQLSNANCSIPTSFDLSNSTKVEFYNHYVTSLSSKIEESTGKVASDIVFQLKPTQALIDDYKTQAYNASVKQLDAERLRDQQASANLALTGELERTRGELHMLQIVALSFLVIGILAVVGFYGYFDKKHGI